MFEDQDDFDDAGSAHARPHDLTLGDICTVTGGKDAGKTVLVIKAGLQTKYGIKAITVEYTGPRKSGAKVWVEPDKLAYNGAQDLETANAIKEADYQEWKAKKQAGVPEMGQQKPWQKFGSYQKRKEPSDEDGSFR